MPGGAFDGVVRGQLAVIVWWLLGAAALCGFLPRVRTARAWWPAAGALAALILLTCLAFTTTASDERTTGELARLAHYAGVLLLVATAVRRATFVAAVAGLATGVAIVSALAVAARLAPSALPADVVRQSFDTTRLSYPLNYWNALGAWAAMGAGMMLVLGAHLRGPAVRAAAAAATPICLLCVYLAYSRAAVLGIVVAVAAAAVLSRHRWTVLAHLLAAVAAAALGVVSVRAHAEIADGTGAAGGATVIVLVLLGAGLCAVGATVTARSGTDRLAMPARTARIALGVTAAVVVVCGVAFGPGLASDAWHSFSKRTIAHTADPAQRLTTLNGNRRNIFASAIAAGREHPLEGIGPGTFEFWWNTDARDPEFLRDGHSLYLEMFAELGWPGAIAVLWLVLALLGSGLLGWRSLRREGSALETGAATAALAAFLVFAVQAGVDWMWESTAVAVVGLAAAGCAIAARQAAAPPRRPARALIVVGALLAVAVQLPPMVSLSRVRASQGDFRRGHVEAARNAAQEAVDAEPWAATPYVQRGLLEEAAGDLAAAAADIVRAERAEPTNWRHPLLLARIRAEQDDPAGAIAAYERARVLRPLSPIFGRG